MLCAKVRTEEARILELKDIRFSESNVVESKVLHDLVSDRTETVATHAGYEVDQVTHSGGPPPSSSSSTSGGALGGFSCYPSCDEADESVPIYNAYNHHYFSWITGSDSEMYELDSPTLMPNPTTTAFRTKENILHDYPTSIGSFQPPLTARA